jgi:hypothetical protein
VPSNTHKTGYNDVNVGATARMANVTNSSGSMLGLALLCYSCILFLYGARIVIEKQICRQRIPPKNVFYYRCPDHQKNYILSFAFAFDREEDIYQVSFYYYCSSVNWHCTIYSHDNSLYGKCLLTTLSLIFISMGGGG